ncbi:MAG: tetratricopeptide repeat protein [Proteobacteria bacterium]|nr:tetratricopeptide repeat protein [Pseudomonadota bacterium]
MSKTYEEIKDIEINHNKNGEEELDEIDIIDGKEEKKPLYSKTVKVLILLIALIAAIYVGYYLGGLYKKRANISIKQESGLITNFKKDEEMKHITKFEFIAIEGTKRELEKKLEELISIKNKDNLTNNNIALILAELGNYNEALTYAEKLIITEPNNPYFWNTFGIILTYLNLFDDAEKSFKKAINLKGDEGVFYYNLGNLYEREGKYDLAKEQYLYYLSKGDKYNSNNERRIKQKISKGI